MNCEQSEELWQRGLDGESILPEQSRELEHHLAECRRCRDLHAASQLLMHPRLGWHGPVVPTGLADRIVRDVLADRRWRQRRTRLVLSGALAASLLIAGLIYMRLSSHIASPESTPIARHNTPADRAQQPTATAGLERSVQEAGSAVVSLTERTARQTLDGGRMLLPDMPDSPAVANADVLHQALATPVDSLRQASTGLSVGLEPVASSARRALNLFFKDMSPVVTSSPRG